MILKLMATLCLLLHLHVSTAKTVNSSEATSYLSQFGYTDNTGRSGHGDYNEAIKRFQKFFHLRVTGRLDAATQKEMQKPRCGVADEVNGRAQNFRTGSKWRKTDLTYRFLQPSRDMSVSQMKDAFVRAFRFWSNVTPLKFREVRSRRSDMTITFRRNDGPGRVLAFAYFPPVGRLSFDEDERYTLRGEVDLLAVAVHEIGHAIGLHHSNVRGSIMWPSYNGYNPNLRLHQDDIRGAQSLYGRNTGGGGGGGGGGSCSDKNTNCGGWLKYCNDQRFRSYMRTNCPKTCRVCGGGSCSDKNTNCGGWLKYCNDQRFVSYMRTNCPKTCAVCGRLAGDTAGGDKAGGNKSRGDAAGGTPTGGGPTAGGAGGGGSSSCKDKSRSCSLWVRRGYCNERRRARFMRNNCAKSCRVC